MAAIVPELSLEERLNISKFSRNACLAAIRGEAVPHALGNTLHRFCVIRGIRYHYGFGHELRGLLPVFTRALNARSIMSNVLPDLESPDTIPYCIWHPETASEDTYRNLAQKHPQLAFQVGRACAVAGYTKLFHELDILPDVHIAEEARECGNLAIYEAIVSQPVRYDIMNDYELRLDLDNRKPAYLNGDSCVRWMLDIKQEFKDHHDESGDFDDLFLSLSFGYEDRMFNITEDMHIDEYESDDTAKRLRATRSNLRWLYEPLPQDLPTVQKDILICMAAYYGDVDRYSRLRRPVHVYSEMHCCVRGIYHNTLFALWWAHRPKTESERGCSNIESAISARFIMNNVLSRVPLRHAPYLIWWPAPAQPDTYRRLAQLQPEMLPQIVRACVYASYEELFAELLPQLEPDAAILGEADSQRNPYFRKALDERLATLGIEARVAEPFWTDMFSGPVLERSFNSVAAFLDANSIGLNFDTPYDGWQCDAATVETTLCLPDAWKVPEDEFDKPDGEPYRYHVDYVEWPPGMATRPGQRRYFIE